MRITWARGGDVIVAPMRDGMFSRTMVASRCGSISVGYFCEPCRASLPHLEALVLHLEEMKPHHIAIYCPDQRRYEAADDAQMRALVGVAA